MLAQESNEWGLTISSFTDGTRPVANAGTNIIPAQNSYGSYAELLSGAAVTDDCYEVEILVYTVGISSTSRDGLVTIGFDEAGGSSYSDKIVDLVCGPASTGFIDWLAGGVVFKFPLFVKAGTSIAAKASVSSANVSGIRVAANLKGRPKRPWLVRAGTFVQTFGADTANSRGTLITPGGASEGAWTQIGSALDKPLWYFDYGYGIADASMTAALIHVDIGLGDASNKRVIIPNARIVTVTDEKMTKHAAGAYADGAVGDLLYARSQSSGTADTDNSVAVYGVGG